MFLSGRAFGYIAYPPRPHGQPTFNEGSVFTGDSGLIAARVVHAPWLTRLQPVFSTHDIHHNDDMYSMHALKQEMPSFPALQRARVRYRWDGEQAYGMLERSNPLGKITHD